MRYLSAGESHGKMLLAVLDGMPAGFCVDEKALSDRLFMRRSGYGRGERMEMETDRAEIVAGVCEGKTIGAPIAIVIPNSDYREDLFSGEKITSARPGHADVIGVVKYGFDDVRKVSERASARDTAIRMSVGELCRQFLAFLGIKTAAIVTAIGSTKAPHIAESVETLSEKARLSPLRCIDETAEKKMLAEIDECKKIGDTLSGSVEIRISGLPMGIGSYAQFDRRMGAIIANAVMSVPSVKSVAIGGESLAGKRGSETVGRITADDVFRLKNAFGGIDGGMTNGDEIIIRADVKPVPSLRRGSFGVDVSTGDPTEKTYQRGDTCVVPAASLIIESAVCFALADEILKATGGDTADEVKRRFFEIAEKAKLKR